MLAVVNGGDAAAAEREAPFDASRRDAALCAGRLPGSYRRAGMIGALTGETRGGMTDETTGETTGGMTGETTGEMTAMSGQGRLCDANLRSGTAGGGHAPHLRGTDYRFEGSDHRRRDAPRRPAHAEEAHIVLALEARIAAMTGLWGHRHIAVHRRHHLLGTRSTPRRSLRGQLRADLRPARHPFGETTGPSLNHQHDPIYQTRQLLLLRFQSVRVQSHNRRLHSPPSRLRLHSRLPNLWPLMPTQHP